MATPGAIRACSPLLAVLAAAAVAGMAGCTAMAYAPAPQDFPRLRVVEHHLPHAEFKDKCTPAVRSGHHIATGAFALLLGASPVPAAIAGLVGPSVEACAQLDFARSECHVYFSADFPPAAIWVRHERERRCRGHDNVGDRVIRDAWAAHKLHQRDALLWEQFAQKKARRDW